MVNATSLLEFLPKVTVMPFCNFTVLTKFSAAFHLFLIRAISNQKVISGVFRSKFLGVRSRSGEECKESGDYLGPR